MRVYDAYIVERELSISNDRIVESNISVDQLRVNFDDEWEGYAKSAILYKDDPTLRFSMALGEDGTCIIPWELLQDTNPINISVVGIKEDDRLVTKQANAILRVEESGLITGVKPSDPTVDQIEQFIAEAQKLVEEAQGKLEDVDTTLTDVKDATESANTAAQGATEAAQSANTAADSANAAADRVDASIETATEAAQNANDAADRVDASIESATQATEAANQATQAATEAADTVTATNEAITEAEAKRVEAETARADAETAREEAEAARAEAETQREADDATRAEADAEYEANEQARQEAESGRATAETAREEAEAKREEAREKDNADQQANNLAQAKNNADQAANNEAAYGREVIRLKDGEFDPSTRKPTVEGKPGAIYQVPKLDPSEGDEYDDWYSYTIDGEKGWERYSSPAVAQTHPIPTNKIDSIIEGNTEQGDEVLETTQLSYYDTARKAANDALYATQIEVALKASQEDLDAATEELNSAIDKKADQTALTDAVSELNDAISLKADQDAMESALALKADKTELPEIVTTEKEGLIPKLPGDSKLVYHGDGTWKEIDTGGWANKTTTFNPDGSITEEMSNQHTVTTFNADGSITEALYSGEELSMTRTTVFEGNTITETVEEA